MSAPNDNRSCTMSGWFAVTATSKAVYTGKKIYIYNCIFRHLFFKYEKTVILYTFLIYLSLVFFGIEPLHLPQPFCSSIGTFPESFGCVDVQDADRARTHDKLVVNEAA